MSGEPLDQPCSEQDYSLYVHVPFCKRKCPYCHFFVQPDEPARHGDFVESLLLEWQHYQPALRGLTLRSIYFGGGTPSLLPAALLAQLLDALAPAPTRQNLEITLEANPESIDAACLLQYWQMGINRLSLGIQSFVDQELQALGRGHSSARAIGAAHCIASSPFKNYSFDFMLETPDQTPSSWQGSLQQLAKAPPSHLSLYNLVIEPDTPFAKIQKRLQKRIADPYTAAAMLQETCSALSSMGLERYEISAFAKDNLYSVHNSGYWRGRTFIGLGPSACSYFQQERFQNHCDWDRWRQCLRAGQKPVGFCEKLKAQAQQAELLAIHLRLCCGVDLSAFERRWGELPQAIVLSLKRLDSQGLINRSPGHVALSARGQLYYEQVASELVLID